MQNLDYIKYLENSRDENCVFNKSSRISLALIRVSSIIASLYCRRFLINFETEAAEMARQAEQDSQIIKQFYFNFKLDNIF